MIFNGMVSTSGIHACHMHVLSVFFVFLQMSGPFHKFSNSVSNIIKNI